MNQLENKQRKKRLSGAGRPKRTRKISSENNLIDAPESDYLYIKPSQLPLSGNGLYTAIPIYKDEIIAIFEGELLTQRQIQIRVNKEKDQYFISMPDGTIMDSYKTECFAKYANDAKAYPDSGFTNNAKIAMSDDDDICLIAISSIKANQEIFCNYGRKYWEKHGR